MRHHFCAFCTTFVLFGLFDNGSDQHAYAQSSAPPTAEHAATFATVNGKEISLADYQGAFNELVRQKFFHGNVPQKELESVRELAKDRLVQRILLIEECERRAIEAEMTEVEGVLARYEAQYANSPAWRDNRERLLPGLRSKIAEQSRLKRLEEQVRNVPVPTEQEVREFYQGRPELFTEPEKIRLSILLLGVDPAAGAASWDSAHNEAKAIVARLRAGADFAEAARLHSSGKYAERGGDMGYLHRGMLPEVLQEEVDKFSVGIINDPISLLEGVAILRLEGKQPPLLRKFDEVAERAKDLLLRERRDRAWSSFLKGLIERADIKILLNQFPTGGAGQH